MSQIIETLPSIDGRLSIEPMIKGTLSSTASVSGNVVIPEYIDAEPYEGEYVITPDFKGQTLNTAKKTCKQDIEVKPIQVEEVSNLGGGTTVYIGGIN